MTVGNLYMLEGAKIKSDDKQSTQEAVDETIRRCLAENILTPFPVSRQKEVQNIMLTLFSQEKISEIHDYNLVKQAKAEGRAEGIAENKLEIAKKLLSIQIPHEQIAMATGLSLAEVEKLAV